MLPIIQCVKDNATREGREVGASIIAPLATTDQLSEMNTMSSGMRVLNIQNRCTRYAVRATKWPGFARIHSRKRSLQRLA